jgi:hypothetical protein
VRWQVNDLSCLHVERNRVMGVSYLDIEDDHFMDELEVFV